MNYNFLIVGGDKRIKILAKELFNDGNNVYTFANKVEDITEIDKIENIKNYPYDIVISSMPLTKDNENVYAPLSDKKVSLEKLKEISKGKKLIAGKIPQDFENVQNEKKVIMTNKIYEDKKIQSNAIKCFDILKDETTTILNTIPTAEGAIQIAMEETDYTITNMKALVIGFGRVGKILANMLKRMGLDVYCEARKETDLAWIKAYGYNPIPLEKMKNNLCKMDIIFNTVPFQILDKSTLILLNKNTLIIDLASAPGGVDYDVAGKLGIKAILASTLPGKVAPNTAGKYLKDFVYKVII